VPAGTSGRVAGSAGRGASDAGEAGSAADRARQARRLGGARPRSGLGAGPDASVGTAAVLRPAAAGRPSTRRSGTRTDRTMNRIVRRSISARDRSRRGTADCTATAAKLRAGDRAGGRGARSPSHRIPSSWGRTGTPAAERRDKAPVRPMPARPPSWRRWRSPHLPDERAKARHELRFQAPVLGPGQCRPGVHHDVTSRAPVGACGRSRDESLRPVSVAPPLRSAASP